jgi:hypothetical protein
MTRGPATLGREGKSHTLARQSIKNIPLRPIRDHPQRASRLITLVDDAALLDPIAQYQL